MQLMRTGSRVALHQLQRGRIPMTLGYRSILRLEDSQDANKIAADQMRSWLKTKQRDERGHGDLDTYEWSGQGTHTLGTYAQLTVVYHSGEDGSARQLLRLEERNKSGTWRVSVTSTSLPNGTAARQLIVVEVDANVELSNGRPVSENTNPPNIVRSLLEVTKARDFHADIPLSPSPALIEPQDIDQLVEALLDPRRSTSIVLAGHIPGAPASRWSRVVESLVKNSAGTTATFILTEEAQTRLNEAMTVTHSVVNGAVRTFLPGVMPSDRTDALRHRVLYPATLAESVTSTMKVRPSLARVHAATARRQLIERPLPHEAMRSARILEREEIRLQEAEASLASMPPISHDRPPLPSQDTDKRPASTYNVRRTARGTTRTTEPVLTALEQLFETYLGTPDLLEETVSALGLKLEHARRAEHKHSQKLDEMLDALNRVRDEVDAAHRQREEIEFELALEAEERRREADRRRHLERVSEFQANKLKALKEFDVFLDPDHGLDDSPASMVDLLARLESEPRVSEFIEFTGDLDRAIDLDIHDGLGRYASTFWEYILVMRDYCHAKTQLNFTGNLFTYLANDHTPGRKCDPKRFAQTESESVKSNTRWRNERIFSIPQSISEDGKILMLAHFKTTARDGVSPRMHIHDDTSGSGRVYIGYIGKHLSNTRTN